VRHVRYRTEHAFYEADNCPLRPAQEIDMNRDRFEGGWKQLSGKMKEHWCNLIDDQPGVVASKREQLAGRIQEWRGISREKAEHELRFF
jgi:uncharacterized protein YjbJ (UPF0337 family)